MKDLTTLDGAPPHPAINDLCVQVKSAEINRRQFLRTAALLGVTVASASTFLGSAL
ncbi:twin-arginine translocation signal domain-containing protein, partial [Pseudomonas edaphica]